MRTAPSRPRVPGDLAPSAEQATHVTAAQTAAAKGVEDDTHVDPCGGTFHERRGERVTDPPGMKDVAFERNRSVGAGNCREHFRIEPRAVVEACNAVAGDDVSGQRRRHRLLEFTRAQVEAAVKPV